MIENILLFSSHPFHQSILRLRLDCVRLRSTFVDASWPPTVPKKKKNRSILERGNGERYRGWHENKKRRGKLFSSGIIGPGSVCVKRFQTAGVFGREEMKISHRYLSPEKYQPRPHFAGHKSINKERTQPLPKKMYSVRVVIGYSVSIHHIYKHTCNLSRWTVKRHVDSIVVNRNSQHFNLRDFKPCFILPWRNKNSFLGIKINTFQL